MAAPQTDGTSAAPAHLPLGGLHLAAKAFQDVSKQFHNFVIHEERKGSDVPRFVEAEEQGIKKVKKHDLGTGQVLVLDGHFSVENGKQIWENWGQSIPKVELAPLPPGLSRFPARLSEVQAIIKALNARYYAPGASHEGAKPHLRVVGHGHSWTPIFADQAGDWVIFSREFAFDDGSAIKAAGFAADGAPLVRITASTTTGQLAAWFEQEETYRGFGWEQPVGLSADAILDNVRYGGLVANGCHGTGWGCQTVSDMVYSISVVNHEGDLVVYDRDSDPALFNAARCSFGLLGVTYELTLKLDGNKAAPLVMVDHFKPPQATYFGPDSGDALKKLVESSYAVEIFWFPLDSYASHVHSYDPMRDRNWVKVFTKRVPATVGQTPRKLDDVAETLRDWLRVNFGGEVNWWAYVCSNPLVMSVFSNFALSQLDGSTGNVLPLTRAIHYQKSIDDFQVNDLEFCFKVDDDFGNVKRAWVAVTDLVREYVADKSKGNPLSVALECRFTAHSDIPLSRAYGKPGDHFCWMEVLSLKDQQYWEEFTDQVAERWIALGLNPKPHWAKWNAPKDPSKPDVCRDLAKKASAPQLADFARVVAKQDPQGMFQTAWLKDLIGLQSQ